MTPEVKKFLEARGAWEMSGWGSVKGHWECTLDYTRSPALRFVPGKDVQQTAQAVLRAAYDQGKHEGCVAGEAAAQERMRRALGLGETNTDGHRRTVVLED